MVHTESGENLDVKSEAFLQAVYEYGGEATTTQILQRTGLNQDERNYRFDKLTELGYIRYTRATSGTGRRDPPKIAHLTDTGCEQVENNGLSDEAREFLVETELHQGFERHNARLDLIENTLSQINGRLDSLERFHDHLKAVLFPS